MSTPICCICQSATLINRHNLRTLAAMAGVVDTLLRHYAERQEPPNLEPWTALADLISLLSADQSLPLDGLTQGAALAVNVEKHWLGVEYRRGGYASTQRPLRCMSRLALTTSRSTEAESIVL